MNITKQQMDALNNCLKCSICVDSCPVTRVDPRFPGPKQLGVDRLRIAQETGEQPNPAVNYCSNCKTCETVCPSGVLVGTLNQLTKGDLPRKGLGLREIIFSNNSILGKLMHIWPQAGNLITALPPVRKIMEKTVGIAAQAPMPAYSKTTLRKSLKGYQPVFTQTPKEVLYFPGCFTQYNKPEVGMALVKILAKLNYKVIIPEFKCCGQPSISNARLKDTRRFAEANLRILKQYLKPGMALLFSCPSCLLTFKEEYKNILGMEEYTEFSSAMLDAGEFLLKHEKQLAGLISASGKNILKLAYHEPCHLRASGLGTPGLSLLKQFGLDITPLEAGCCGLSGSYGLKTEKHGIAEEIGMNLKKAIAASNYREVVTECGMCSVQIKHLTKLPTSHPLELLAMMLKE
ncbi:MAG TPA: anaerobic glycerol-3-phosphate dehydrogenase subunit C [Peptococcaceae bacterium]|nr:anaerobic glycerol-3-phosphate dehydrogenase subunit C [Peptococcaceae bacterium]